MDRTRRARAFVSGPEVAPERRTNQRKATSWITKTPWPPTADLGRWHAAPVRWKPTVHRAGPVAADLVVGLQSVRLLLEQKQPQIAADELDVVHALQHACGGRRVPGRAAAKGVVGWGRRPRGQRARPQLACVHAQAIPLRQPLADAEPDRLDLGKDGVAVHGGGGGGRGGRAGYARASAGRGPGHGGRGHRGRRVSARRPHVDQLGIEQLEARLVDLALGRGGAAAAKVGAAERLGDGVVERRRKARRLRRRRQRRRQRRRHGVRSGRPPLPGPLLWAGRVADPRAPTF